jgi:hypothetical protein
VKKIILLVLMTVLILCLGIGAKMYMDSKKLHEEMIAVVKSEEAKQVFEKGLHNLDPKAFTPEGIIQSYEIDFESINHNPMGGINVTLVINNDNDLTTEYDINKGSDGLKGGGIVISPLLTKQIDGEHYE